METNRAMTDLSPAAQAVSDASHEAWVTKDDPWSIAAAALRAAAEQVRTDRNLKRHYAATMAEMLVLDKLLAIAAELEDQHE